MADSRRPSLLSSLAANDVQAQEGHGSTILKRPALFKLPIARHSTSHPLLPTAEPTCNGQLGLGQFSSGTANTRTAVEEEASRRALQLRELDVWESLLRVNAQWFQWTRGLCTRDRHWTSVRLSPSAAVDTESDAFGAEPLSPVGKGDGGPVAVSLVRQMTAGLHQGQHHLSSHPTQHSKAFQWDSKVGERLHSPTTCSTTAAAQHRGRSASLEGADRAVQTIIRDLTGDLERDLRALGLRLHVHAPAGSPVP